MVISPESVKRVGFRFPTEAEWEYFCRAGTETSRPYGESIELLPRHAWTWLNSGNRVKPPGLLLPNEFGLFDVLGNAWEWCQDGTLGHYVQGVSRLPPYPHATRENPAPDMVRTETVDSQDRAHETWRMLRGGAFTAMRRIEPDRHSETGSRPVIIVNTSVSGSCGPCRSEALSARWELESIPRGWLCL